MAARQHSTRAVLIYAALIFLCVSDGVGPRLVPFTIIDSKAEPSSLQAGSPQHLSHNVETNRNALRQKNSPDSTAQPTLADEVNKLPIFFASELCLVYSTQICERAGGLNRRLQISIATSLKEGRGPPAHV